VPSRPGDVHGHRRAILTYNSLAHSGSFIAEPVDRLFVPIDPARRAARQRFISVLVAAFSLHALLLIILFVRDRADSDAEVRQEEIPVELVNEMPQPPPPPPEEKKKEKEKVEKQPQEKPKVEFNEKPAFDAPRAANQEVLKRSTSDPVTQGPTQSQPATAAEAKPDKPAPPQTAAPEPTEKTASRETPEDKPDAEALDKAAPEKSLTPQQKVKPTKERAKVPNDEKSRVAQQLAALAPAPNFSFASASKVTPVDGGTEDMRYLTVVWGMIMRQKHDPAILHTRHVHAVVSIGFFLDDTGHLVHEALYRTSGYPEIDAEAIAAVKRAAPFPPPPPGTRPHLVATMEFKE
jgi:TonB family protein